MSLSSITIPSVEVPHFDGNDFLLWKIQMSTYLCKMNPQVWWMVNVGLSHALQDRPQIQAQKKYLYLEAHASNGLSSVLSAEIKDKIKMEYDWPERANLLWKVLEQMYGSSNSKKSSSSAPENISSVFTHFDQDQEEQSTSVQKEELSSATLEKSDGLVFQSGESDFGRIEKDLSEEDDCSTSSSDVDDDDDIDNEYDEQELLVEFRKLIRKHMKLQKRHGDLLCSHNELINSYALLESAHEVMVTKVKDFEPHTCTCAPPSLDLSCANSYCSQAKSSCDEHVLVETCDSFITNENDELKRENEMLKMELSRLKGKDHVQPSQDNSGHMVKKLKKGSTVTCAKLPQINLKASYQKVNEPKIKKKAHVKCFECSILGHFLSECPNRKSDQAKPSRRQRSLSQRRCFGSKEKYHDIAVCPKKEASKQVCQNQTVQFGKPEYSILVEIFRTLGQCNKSFKVVLDKYMSKNKSTKRQSNNKASRIKYQTCYTCRDKGHLSKNCAKTQIFIHKIVNDNITHLGPKIDTSTIKVVSSPCDSHRGIWVPKHLLTNQNTY
jgi:hypothetical protein